MIDWTTPLVGAVPAAFNMADNYYCCGIPALRKPSL
jgi:hypothetical protein